jgi:hypothetical protein
VSDKDLLLADLHSHGMQSSTDWEADERFARALGMVELADLVSKMIRSDAPWPVKWSYHRTLVRPTITERRMRALYALVKAGAVESWWMRGGEGSRTEHGAPRFRCYDLRPAAGGADPADPG